MARVLDVYTRTNYSDAIFHADFDVSRISFLLPAIEKSQALHQKRPFDYSKSEHLLKFRGLSILPASPINFPLVHANFVQQNLPAALPAVP